MGQALGIQGVVAMSNVKSSGRIHQIDALRGMASLAVCWFHLTNGYDKTSLIRASGSYGWLGVEMFFVISGFVIPYAMHKGGYEIGKNWATFIGKRILRIDPPYLIAALLALLLWYASSMVPGFKGQAADPSLAELVLHLGYLNGIVNYPWLNPVFWTLAIEFQYYLLISLVFHLVSSGHLNRRLPVLLAFLILPFFFHDNTYVFRFLGLFMLGISAFQFRVGVIGRIEMISILILAALSIGFSLGWAECIAGLFATVLMLVDWNARRMRPLLFLGTISYSLYLLHVPIGGRVINLGRRYVESGADEWLLSCLALAICLFCSTVFWRWIERPAQEWASRWKYRV